MSRAGALHNRTDMQGGSGGLVGRGVTSGARPTLFGAAAPAGRGNGAFQEQMEEVVEQENDAMLDEIGAGAKGLLHFAQSYRDELATQDRIITDMEGGFGTARSDLKGARAKFDSVFQSAGSKHMCILVAFCFAVFIGLYYLMKAKRG
eukprot:TRINITY_DN9450_c0_g1_i1.p2 TRINITY_DN9450_c0_g1~~TRINITY_DN9450_c0_g1_i1.p2  ORF type:complete len:148 (+),score=20.21 TRINITY_DN9450_c0_g1_i1:45-488(+)